MDKQQFDKTTNQQMIHCLWLLEEKAKEYVHSEDRLEHFKSSAELQDINPKEALWGMVLKHITSLGGMCRNNNADKDLWIEKISDTINYMLLLRALVEEDTAQ